MTRFKKKEKIVEEKKKIIKKITILVILKSQLLKLTQQPITMVKDVFNKILAKLLARIIIKRAII